MNNDAMGMLFGGVGLVFLLIFIVIFVLYMLSLSKALRLAGPQNRKMEPGLVWLNLIPLFNMGWIIFTVLKVSEAINNKHTENGTPDPSEGAKTIGLLYTIFALLTLIPILGMFLGLASLILWIVYWVKVSGYNNAMQQMTSAPAAADDPS
ncbi:hypothetical protein KO507_08385 [Gilvimarinus agarilyticus]|uniref:hypothetical protein n=1 Tax=unclassified Gilvimarinus TaxID=2642066 RepID=UPI001C09A52B|nr:MULTISPECIES: hypothetical protein [unclassified Gilvimarinus]MBU2885777.1 hypothetical protein [Gilvimarinus agarilyticus]MDO6570630.1 hypothetical protein [Gilvimarinus sp. 2_MG-2023]MDO6746205.1 hypothetical protein [Gilvimarinus sp. 1_MG-2023]